MKIHFFLWLLLKVEKTLFGPYFATCTRNNISDMKKTSKLHHHHCTSSWNLLWNENLAFVPLGNGSSIFKTFFSASACAMYLLSILQIHNWYMHGRQNMEKECKGACTNHVDSHGGRGGSWNVHFTNKAYVVKLSTKGGVSKKRKKANLYFGKVFFRSLSGTNKHYLLRGLPFWLLPLGEPPEQFFGKSWEFGPTDLTPPPRTLGFFS